MGLEGGHCIRRQRVVGTNLGCRPGGGLRRHWDADDQLPEWATENPSDYGGVFLPWIMGSCSLALKVNLRTQQQIQHRLCFGIDRK
ncbi:hypothetical protein quinque_006921 [Culex quinquefasciatus]